MGIFEAGFQALREEKDKERRTADELREKGGEENLEKADAIDRCHQREEKLAVQVASAWVGHSLGGPLGSVTTTAASNLICNSIDDRYAERKKDKKKKDKKD